MKPRACLVMESGPWVESTGSFRLVTGRKGMAVWKISLEGVGAHAGNDHGTGRSAIIGLSQIVLGLSSITNYSKELTVNVGIVEGGSTHNAVPMSASALVEMRCRSKEYFDEGVKQVEDFLNACSKAQESEYLLPNIQATRDLAGCRVMQQRALYVPPWFANRETEDLLALWKQTAQHHGFNVESMERGGLSDASYLSTHFPVLDGLGPHGGGLHNAIRNEEEGIVPEWLDWDNMAPKCALNVEAIAKLLQ